VSSTGLAAEPPYGSLSSNSFVHVRGERDERFLSTHAISRGVMGLSFQGSRGEMLLPMRGRGT
jgi:hypothetical protein